MAQGRKWRAKRPTKREGKRRVLRGKATRRRPKLKLPRARNTAAIARSRAQGTKRRDRDAYLTIQTSADAILWRLRYLLGPVTKVLEPSAGTGNLVRAIKEVWPEARVLAVDLFDKHHMALHEAGATSYIIGDFLTQDVRGFDADVSVSNPPFSAAEAHIRHALAQLRDGAYHVALLPTTFLCAQCRARGLYNVPEPMLEDETTWPSQRVGEWGPLRWVMPLAERPSFTGDGKTDMVEYAIFIFQKGWTGGATLLAHCWRSDAIVLREFHRREVARQKAAEAEDRKKCLCGCPQKDHPCDGCDDPRFPCENCTDCSTFREATPGALAEQEASRAIRRAQEPLPVPAAGEPVIGETVEVEVFDTLGGPKDPAVLPAPWEAEDEAVWVGPITGIETRVRILVVTGTEARVERVGVEDPFAEPFTVNLVDLRRPPPTESLNEAEIPSGGL